MKDFAEINIKHFDYRSQKKIITESGTDSIAKFKIPSCIELFVKI